ncbi:MAG: hypothetical protein J2P48_10465 [Alphaproteobacteria bacterium]|nr:hypothetical protein [Alphaproteobacteria bacterium]
MTSPDGMILEQVWQAARIPHQRLFFGRPGGAAMPFARAHAKFVRLLVSRAGPSVRPPAGWVAAHRGSGGRRGRPFGPHGGDCVIHAGARRELPV